MGNLLRAALFQKSVQTRQNCERALCVSVHERPEVSVIFSMQFLARLSHLKAVSCTVQHFWKSFTYTPPHVFHINHIYHHRKTLLKPKMLYLGILVCIKITLPHFYHFFQPIYHIHSFIETIFDPVTTEILSCQYLHISGKNGKGHCHKSIKSIYDFVHQFHLGSSKYLIGLSWTNLNYTNQFS